MKPFSSSAFKVLIWIIATTIKIRTLQELQPLSRETFGVLKISKLLQIWCQVSIILPSLKLLTWASSIFRADEFDRSVITHCLEDIDFHDHLPIVLIHQHLFWGLNEWEIRRFNLALGASRVASSAYQKWPTMVISDFCSFQKVLFFNKERMDSCIVSTYSKFENKLREFFPQYF